MQGHGRDRCPRRRPARPPLLGRARPGDRGPLAGPLGGRGHLRDAEPRRGPERRVRRAVAEPPQGVRARHVPVPVGRRPARRPPAGLHRHRHLHPLPADDRPQRAAPDGLRRLRAAGRAVRAARRTPTRGSPPSRTSPPSAASCRRLGFGLRLGPRGRRPPTRGYYRWTQWIFLQLFDTWFDAEAGQGPARSPSWWPSSTPAPATAPRHQPAGDGLGRARRVRAPPVVDAHRLAYLAEVPVNWCPGLGTVLANEEVTADGRSERGNFPVYRRPLTQWMLRITAYAERLLADLDGARLARRHQGDAAQLDRPLDGRRGRRSPTPAGATIEVFTTRPDTLFGATYMVLAPEHPLVDALTTDAWPDGTAVVDRRCGDPDGGRRRLRRQPQPLRARPQTEAQGQDRRLHRRLRRSTRSTASRSPCSIADYVLMGYGTGAIMAVPGQDERDFEFAEAFDLPIVAHGRSRPRPGWRRTRRATERTARRPIASSTPRSASTAWTMADAKAAITAWLEDARPRRAATVHVQAARLAVQPPALLGRAVPDRVRRRRRAAGRCPTTPLPAARCRRWTTSPRRPPTTRTPSPSRRWPGPTTGSRSSSTWATARRAAYRREPNTMPQLGRLVLVLPALPATPTNDDALRRPGERSATGWARSRGRLRRRRPLRRRRRARRAAPAVRPLLAQGPVRPGPRVARAEPFRRLFNQGYIQAYAYPDDARLLRPGRRGRRARRRGTVPRRQAGHPRVREDGQVPEERRSTPDEMFERVRRRHPAPLRDVRRAARPVPAVGHHRPSSACTGCCSGSGGCVVDEDDRRGPARRRRPSRPTTTRRVLHRTIAAVRDGMETLRFNTSIARITELTNHLTAGLPRRRRAPRPVAEPLVLLLAPLAPHLAEELWARLGHAAIAGLRAVPGGRPERWLVDDTVEAAGPGQRQGARPRHRARRRRRAPPSRRPPGPTTRSPPCSTARPSAR